MDIAITFPSEQVEVAVSRNPEKVEAAVTDGDTVIAQVATSDSVVVDVGVESGITMLYDEKEDRVTAIIA